MRYLAASDDRDVHGHGRAAGTFQAAAVVAVVLDVACTWRMQTASRSLWEERQQVQVD